MSKLTSEEKEQLISILRMLNIASNQSEEWYRNIEDAIRDLADIFEEEDDEDEML